MVIYSGFSHWKWRFSIISYVHVYQRVIGVEYLLNLHSSWLIHVHWFQDLKKSAVNCEPQALRNFSEVIWVRLPGLVKVYITNWKDPPFCSWVNQLFRLGHGFQFANGNRLPECKWNCFPHSNCLDPMRISVNFQVIKVIGFSGNLRLWWSNTRTIFIIK